MIETQIIRTKFFQSNLKNYALFFVNEMFSVNKYKSTYMYIPPCILHVE